MLFHETNKYVVVYLLSLHSQSTYPILRTTYLNNFLVFATCSNSHRKDLLDWFEFKWIDLDKR